MKKKQIILLIVAICLLAVVGLTALFIHNHSVLKPAIGTESRFYVNGVLSEGQTVTFDHNDVRELIPDGGQLKYISHAEGFSLNLPEDSKPDFTYGDKFARFESKLADIVISKEPIPELYTAKEFVAEYINRYIVQEKYLTENHITMHKNDMETIGNYEVQIMVAERTPAKSSKIKRNTYVYCYIYADTRLVYRILFKADRYDDALMEQVYTTLSSFSEDVKIMGKPVSNTNFRTVLPENWTDETRALYERIANSDTVDWGIFMSQAVKHSKFEQVRDMEEKIDYEFEVLLDYVYYRDPFPLEGMQKAYEMGKLVEMTMQISTTMNLNLDGYNPMFDVADGVFDDAFRQFAKGAKAFGKPFLFRLNNEMNSDWTSYGATAAMNDPDFFVAVWHRIYRIFEEEGVNNAIWIFNPNNNSYPPQNYNDTLAYYPGNGYVHMFGVTGYNTGTYYEKENLEGWSEFEYLYDNIDNTFAPHFGWFPWIITEFGSSSIGGDKCLWMERMFDKINKYENIKIAVWFNANDIDTRPGKNNAIARPYVLDETPETTAAFRKGIAAFKK